MATVLRNTRRRRLVALAALLVATGACGESESNAPPGIGSTLTAPTEPGSVTTTGGSDGTTRRGAPATAKPGGSGGSGRSDGSPSTSNDDELRAAANGPPGAFAGMLLASGPADDLVLDVLVQAGASADSVVISQLRQLLASSSGKSVAVRGPTTLSSSRTVHSADDLRRLADDQGKPEQGDGAGVVHLLYLDGAFTDDGVLGVTVRGDVIGIFPDQVAGAATPFVSRARIERAVATHELGHVLGLVDLYLDEARDDPEHPGHSTNPRSVMYWAVEADVVTQVLGGPPPVDFDAADQADLREIRSGAPPG